MKATIASAASALSVALTYCVIYFTSPEDPEYAESGFSWTLTYFAPAVLLSAITSLIALIVYFVTSKKGARTSVGGTLLPLVLLLPFVGFMIHMGWRLAPLWAHR